VPNYKRNLLAGGTFFFTVTLQDRSKSTLTDHIKLLRSCIQHVQTHHPFEIDAAVVLPDHLHMIWTLPKGDAAYPTRWRLIKSRFSRQLNAADQRTASKRKKSEKGIWQRRYLEHTIRDEDDFAAHMDYVHYNPVKHGYVTRPADWPHASIHRYIRQGLLDKDWGIGGMAQDLDYE